MEADISFKQKQRVESARQRSVNVKGRKLETNVKQILNTLLNKKHIKAIDVGRIRKFAKADPSYRELAEHIKLSCESTCGNKMIYPPDRDIFVFYEQESQVRGGIKRHPLCLVNCQISFHARETEPLFWSILIRNKVKYVLVTEDSDRYNDEKPKTELGSCLKCSKIRNLFECFLEKAYIIKKYDKINDGLVKDINDFYNAYGTDLADNRKNGIVFFDDPKRKPHAGYCGKIVPFDDLLFDIMKRKSEVV